MRREGIEKPGGRGGQEAKKERRPGHQCRGPGFGGGSWPWERGRSVWRPWPSASRPSHLPTPTLPSVVGRLLSLAEGNFDVDSYVHLVDLVDALCV